MGDKIIHKPIRIGILTFWDSSDNYGQLLQCYALQTFLKKMGYSPFLIKYKPSFRRKSVIQQLYYYLNILLSINKIKSSLQRRWNKFTHKTVIYTQSRCFDDFREKHLESTQQIYDLDSLDKQPPEADFYVCGSDQIWSWPNDGFFLNWGKLSIPKIAYAPSFGTSEISEEFCSQINPWLSKFKVITVREASGIDICKKAGRSDAICVPDPTLLLLKSDYLELTSSLPAKSNKYLLIYLLGNSIDFDFTIIDNFIKENGIKIKYIASQNRDDDYEKLFPTIPEWLTLIQGAEFIITNSFHGCVFSLLYNKKFLVVPLTGKYKNMNVRIESLLLQFDLLDRFFEKNIDKIHKHIDYEIINIKLTEKRQEILSSMQIWFTND